MISQFFILSARGDTLIMRDYRSDVSKNVPEKFFREVKTSEMEVSPTFEKDGIIFGYLKRASLYLVFTTRFNMAPSLLMDMLIRVSSVIKDLCGTMNEDAVRKNFIMIYEILDEMMDFGFPQQMKTRDVINFPFFHLKIIFPKFFFYKFF